jgi:hypothetical protein
MSSSNEPLFCHRCGTELHPGSRECYLVHIAAFADPFPPVIEEHGPDYDFRREIERLVEQLNELSPQEALDQVYRRLTMYLCTPCYRRWIENPTG